jgi:hypothetical protein
MDEMTVKMEQTLLRTQGKRLLDLLQTAAKQFRNGEDAVGIEGLLTAAAELGNLVETDRNSRRPQIDLSRLLLSLRKLYFYIHNQDITGIADFLEDALCPLTEQWLRGCGDT